MENATKALIITAGVLIAMLILSIGVYFKSNLSKTADTYSKQLDAVELQKYNSNFEIYANEERRNNITVQEIVSLISISQQQEQGTQIYIGTENVTKYDENDKNKLLEDHILKYNKDPNTATGYNVEHTYSYVSMSKDQFGKVIEIKFKEN